MADLDNTKAYAATMPEIKQIDEVEAGFVNKYLSQLFSNHQALGRVWQHGRAYIVGDIAYHPNLPSWAYLECIQAGTSGATEPTWPGVGEEVSDGTARWRVRDIKSGSGVQIGTIMPFLALSPPAGWLACDTGALISRATYAELWAWVQDNAPLTTEAEWQAMAAAQTSVGYYSSGDGSTTFRLPRLVDFVRGSDSVNGRDVGMWEEDAIRNIVGTLSLMQSAQNDPLAINPTGAFTITDTGVNGNSSSGGNAVVNIGFDASLVVLTADENRPKNVSMLYCVKAFDAIVNEGLIDVTELANEVAGLEVTKQNKVQYALIVDEKTIGTNGGTFTSGDWRTRDLNVIKINDNSFTTLGSNQITLPAGKYRFSIKAPAYMVGAHKARLYNITDSSAVAYGMSTMAANSGNGFGVSNIDCLIEITATTIFEVQHRGTTTVSSTGFGAAASFGWSEIYTVVKIWKEG